MGFVVFMLLMWWWIDKYGFSITLDALSAMVTGDVQQDVRVQELWAAGVKYESIKDGDDLRFFNELLLSAKKN